MGQYIVSLYVKGNWVVDRTVSEPAQIEILKQRLTKLYALKRHPHEFKIENKKTK